MKEYPNHDWQGTFSHKSLCYCGNSHHEPTTSRGSKLISVFMSYVVILFSKIFKTEIKSMIQAVEQDIQ